jgi:hypothetical protein
MNQFYNKLLTVITHHDCLPKYFGQLHNLERDHQQYLSASCVTFACDHLCPYDGQKFHRRRSSHQHIYGNYSY